MTSLVLLPFATTSTDSLSPCRFGFTNYGEVSRRTTSFDLLPTSLDTVALADVLHHSFTFVSTSRDTIPCLSAYVVQWSLFLHRFTTELETR